MNKWIRNFDKDINVVLSVINPERKEIRRKYVCVGGYVRVGVEEWGENCVCVSVFGISVPNKDKSL